MNIKKLEKFVIEKKLPQFRLKQIKQAIYKEACLSFAEITTLPADLRATLVEQINIMSLKSEKILIANDKASIKTLLVTTDGSKTESVIIKNSPGRWTVCLSAQVGCPIGCAFCATGQSGFKRNLESEEISDQVLFWQNYLKNNIADAKVDSLVFMGMGEPFLNWENVKGAIKDLINPELFGLGARCVSVSTIGIPAGIKKLAKDFPQVNLAVSIHSANEKKRAALVPVSHEYNLVKLRQAIDYYLGLTNRKVFIEYVLLADVNDSKEDARELADYLKTFTKPYLLHVNLISYNKTKAIFRALAAEQAERFKDELSRNKVSVTIRKSLGKEIEGACGQLAGK